MKKIIAILAMVALVGGVAFAEASVGGHVIGTVNLLESDTSDPTDGKIFGSAGLNRVRVEAQGSDEDGKFGAWVRIEGGMNGYAWWKPIEQFQMRIGNNGYDGFNSKDGVTRWGFYQTVTDTGVTFGGDNAWGSSVYLSGVDRGIKDILRASGVAEDELDDALEAFKKTDEYKMSLGSMGFNFSSAFFGGYGGTNALMLEIKPVEVFGVNISLPYFDRGEVKDIFGGLTLQLDLNLDIGNIALTYVGDAGDDTNGDVYLYAGLGFGNVALDIGLGLTLEGDKKKFPINVGLGAKVDISETFGLKARVGASVPTDSDYKVTKVLVDVLPYFAVNDSVTVFVSVGLGLIDFDGDNVVGFHFNPYIQVGSEWGPKFLAGIKVWQDYADGGDSIYGGDSYINWAVPIALNVSF